MGLEIALATGNIAEQDVNGGINSASGMLFSMGSGTAGQYREKAPCLSVDDKIYWETVKRAREKSYIFKGVLDNIHQKRPVPSKAQLIRLQYIEDRGYRWLKRGDAAVFPGLFEGSELDYVADAVGMSYGWRRQPDPNPIYATHSSVKNSAFKALKLLDEKGCVKVAVPPMCTNKGGMTEETSMEAIFDAISKFEKEATSIKEIKITLYSPELEAKKEWFSRKVEEYKSRLGI